MPSIAKPRVAHPSLKRNDVGLTVRDYEGSMSTLCAGCGHDSIILRSADAAVGWHVVGIHVTWPREVHHVRDRVRAAAGK